jgi:carboxylesterase type B
MTTAEFPEVRATAGRVRGKRAGAVSVFRGIPFAAPPVGDARFAAPRPAPAWDGVREAFSHIRSAWTAFARTGEPGWPAFDVEERLTQVFGTEPRLTRYPEETSRRIWRDDTVSALPLL